MKDDRIDRLIIVTKRQLKIQEQFEKLIELLIVIGTTDTKI